MADGTPSATELLGGGIKHLGDADPVCRKVTLGDGVQCRVGFFKQLGDRGFYVSWRDAIKQGKRGKVEQRVCHAFRKQRVVRQRPMC